MKRVISMLLAAILVCSVFTVTAEPVNASTSDWQFFGSTCTSNSSAAATINYIRAKYEHYSTYKGSGQCFGWTEKVGNMLAKECSTKYYKGLKFTKSNFLKKCNGIKAGAHLRLSHNKEYNGYSGHSICLLKVSKKKDLVCWTDNNYAGYETIAYYKGTIDQFVSYYSHYEYLNMITKTTKYKTQKEPLLATEKAANGRTKLYWTKTTSTSKYKVYRATSKNGTYRLIKTTTGKNYTDTSAKYGTKYYYKVKSVKSGTDKYSNKCYSTARLNKPVIIDYGNNEKTGKIWIKWKKVPNASKYYIYRAVNDGKYKYYAATTKTTFTNTKAANPANRYSYKVKAIYSKNKKGNSYSSDPSYWLYPHLAAPKVSHTVDETANQMTLSWKKVPYATSYCIYYRDQGSSYYSYFNSTEELSFIVDLNSMYEGYTYEFWVQAYPDSGCGSEASNLIEVYVPDDGIDDEYWWYY